MVGGRVGLRNPFQISDDDLPSLAISETFLVSSEAAMLALTAQTGDVAIRTDESKTYKLRGTDPSVLGDWEELLSPSSAGLVTSVNGFAGVVVLDTDDISEGSVNFYYTDARVSAHPDVVSAITHIADMSNPHNTGLSNMASCTLSELNSLITDATLDSISGTRTPTVHATTHEQGGSDELTVQLLGSDAASSDKLLKTDGSGGWSLIDLLSISGAGTIFGTEFLSAEEDWESSTTSTSYQEKLSLTASGIDSGNYLLLWYAEMRSSSASSNKNSRLRVVLNDSEVVARSQEDGNDYNAHGGFSVESLASGTHKVDIDFSRAGGINQSFVRNAKITLWRAS